MRVTKPAMLALVLLLSGCGAQPTHVAMRIEVVAPRIPSSLLVCPEAPVVPTAVRQAQVASYVTRLWEAHQICHNHLAAVAQAISALPVQPTPVSR